MSTDSNDSNDSNDPNENKPAVITEARHEKAHGIVRRNSLWAAGIGAIAVPWIDILGVAGIQLKMLNEMSDVYGHEFSKNWGKFVIAALVGGLGHRTLAFGVLASTLKAIPGIGSLFGALTVPIFSGAVTYAIGHVFVMHFESNGTFLNFDPKKLQAEFNKAFEAGKAFVSAEATTTP